MTQYNDKGKLSDKYVYNIIMCLIYTSSCSTQITESHDLLMFY